MWRLYLTPPHLPQQFDQNLVANAIKVQQLRHSAAVVAVRWLVHLVEISTAASSLGVWFDDHTNRRIKHILNVNDP